MSSLSGGEKQRVPIARCLLKNPDILVLDEATSALDTVTENAIQKALAGLSRNRTVMVIAHRLGTVKAADQICVLGGGKVAELGAHEELMQLGGKYTELWYVRAKRSQIYRILGQPSHPSLPLAGTCN